MALTYTFKGTVQVNDPDQLLAWAIQERGLSPDSGVADALVELFFNPKITERKDIGIFFAQIESVEDDDDNT